MKKLLLLSILTVTFFSSCIQTPEPDSPRRLAIVLNVANVGNDIVVDQDTVNIEVVKLLADKINFSFLDDRILQTQPDALVMTYRNQFEGEDETIVAANIGIDDFRGFKGMRVFIDTPKEGDNISDNQFFGSSDNYSFILTGSFNGKNFTYLSSPVFEKNFPFDSSIELTNENETLFSKIFYDMSEVLIDNENNQLLDPTNPDNQATIDSLLQESLEIEARAIDIL